MAIASSTSSRRQCSSHGAGQTRPSTDGNGIVRLKMRVLSRQFGLGVGLEEARDVDVARALVLARRQAVGVVVAEDQLEVRPAQPADLLGLGLDLHLRLARPRAADRRVLLALDLDDAHPARAEARQLGLVAEGRDLDPVVAADLEDRLALEALDDAAVDLDPDARRRLRALRRLRVEQALGERSGLGRRGGCRGASAGRPWVALCGRDPTATAIGWQTPAGQELRRMWSSSSDRKYRIPLASGRVVRRSWSHSAEPTMSADRSARSVDVGRPRAAVDDAVGDLDEPARADPARDRLAARLAGAEPGQQAGQVHDAGAVVGDDDRARADVGAGRAQRARSRRACRARRGGSRPPDGPPTRTALIDRPAGSAPPRRDDLAQRRAERDLGDAVARRRPDLDQDRARARLRPGRGERLGAVADDPARRAARVWTLWTTVGIPTGRARRDAAAAARAGRACPRGPSAGRSPRPACRRPGPVGR